ncbi:hypothetical protein C0431_13135 [bacterium]|nr:hypothetical protein [bacterium]
MGFNSFRHRQVRSVFFKEKGAHRYQCTPFCHPREGAAQYLDLEATPFPIPSGPFVEPIHMFVMRTMRSPHDKAPSAGRLEAHGFLRKPYHAHTRPFNISFFVFINSSKIFHIRNERKTPYRGKISKKILGAT